MHPAELSVYNVQKGHAKLLLHMKNFDIHYPLCVYCTLYLLLSRSASIHDNIEIDMDVQQLILHTSYLYTCTCRIFKLSQNAECVQFTANTLATQEITLQQNRACHSSTACSQCQHATAQKRSYSVQHVVCNTCILWRFQTVSTCMPQQDLQMLLDSLDNAHRKH